MHPPHGSRPASREVPSVVRQKFHDTRWRGSGRRLGIGLRLGCQTLVVRSGGDGWRRWQDSGGVVVAVDGRALSSALADPGERQVGLVVGGWPLTQEPSGFAYARLSAGSDSVERCRSILSSARDALVRPPHALSAYQARFTFSKMSRALAVQIYGLGLRLCWVM
jgi:hypothetical protein